MGIAGRRLHLGVPEQFPNHSQAFAEETIVKDYVRERRLGLREMFVPLSHPPGHAQADFGEADAIIAGVKYRAHFFVMTLPHSDACFVAAYPAATTEAWLDGHNRAFVFFGGVPQSILYDNDKCLVSRILSDGTRQRTRAFSGLQSHYLFEDRYGRPGKGNDKGNVEGVVGYARRNFMTPLPRFASWDAFNGHLEGNRSLKPWTGDSGFIVQIESRPHRGAGNMFCHALSSLAWRFSTRILAPI